VDGWELRVYTIEGHRIRTVQAARLPEPAEDSDDTAESVLR